MPMTADDHADVEVLFSPVRLGALELRNRLVMAPLTRNRALPGNYGQRASAGLIIAEATQVSAQAVGYPNTPGLHTPEQAAAWRLVTDAVHARGGLIVVQLWHVGRVSHPSMQPDGALPVAPSALAPEGAADTYTGPQPFVTPRALERDELPGLVADFAHAASLSRDAGFDGVEIHGANGYLLDQFLRDGSNRRTDEYGGSQANRARLLLEVTRATLDVLGPGRVGVRLSPLSRFNGMRDSDPLGLTAVVAAELDRLPLAYLHVIDRLDARSPGARADAVARRTFRGPLILNSGYGRESAAQALSAGRGEAVAFGEAFLANPDLVERYRAGRELNVPDEATYYGGDARGYTDYPFLDGRLVPAEVGVSD